MTDPLEEVFARSRAAAVREVRPPGPAAARRAVRRRRTAMAAAAIAGLMVVGGSSMLVRHAADRHLADRHAAGQPAPRTPEEAGLAYAAVLDGPPMTPAIESLGPVFAGYTRREQVYVSALVLRVACAGTGRFALVVDGRPDRVGKLREVTRAAVVCAARPVAVERRFTLPGKLASEIVVRLAGADAAAAARAQFAYRLAGLRSVPGLGPDDPANSPVEILSGPGEDRRQAAAGTVAPSHAWQNTGKIVAVAGRRYTVAAACAGAGSLDLQARKQDGSMVEDRVQCSWPPLRHRIEVGALDRGTTVWLRYNSADPAEARYGWAVIEN